MDPNQETVVETSGTLCPHCHTVNPPGATRCHKCNGALERTPPPVPTTGAVASGWSVPAPPAEGVLGSLAALQPGAVLGGRYEIVQKLGEGGMGAVYKARDRELDRLVAVKVIRPELAGREEILQRFKQELILARQVTHRNVIRIFDLGQGEGLKFITMEYVEGQDLKTVLKQRHKLPPKEAARIIQQVCRALDAAHSEGVTHRDLKPPNVMLEENGRALVMDFGIARSMEMSGLTQTGMLVGTPEYMSPEQARGEKVDTRSDLFSLGIIFYEMLTGSSPYHSETAMGTLFKRMQKDAVPPIKVDASIPQALSDVVVNCLARDPAQRYQSAQQILADLDAWLGSEPGTAVIPPFTPRRRAVVRRWKWAAAAGLAVLLLLAVAGVTFRDRIFTRGPSQQKPVVLLVADFNNVTGDPVFDGTLESMFNIALEAVAHVNAYDRAQARQIARQLRPDATKLDESLAQLVARREGVHVVVSGSIARQGDAYDVATRATDAVTGKLIASGQTRAANREAVLSTVAKLAAPLRKALGDVTPESAQIAAAETYTASSVHVANIYALAQEHMSVGRYEEAIRGFLQAAELDPNLGRAYTGLAIASVNLKRDAEAEKYFKKSLALMDRMSEREKYRALGAYYLGFVRNYDQAIETYRQLVSKFPADSVGYNNLAAAYAFAGNLSEALAANRRSLEIHPSHLRSRANFAYNSMYAGDFDTAISEAQRVLTASPNYDYPFLPIALSKLIRGDTQGARETYARLEKVGARGFSRAKLGEADLEMHLGRYKEALSALQAGIAADEKEKGSGELAYKYVALAEAYLASGQAGPAASAAEKASQLSERDAVLLPAARVLLQAGQEGKARAIANRLHSKIQNQTKAGARLIEGEIALQRKRLPEAVEAFREGQKLHDSWMSHFLLGRAYLEAGHFAEASGEFDSCQKRRSETTDLFLTMTPTLRYLPPLYYWLGRAQEGLGTKDAARASYEQFLKLRTQANPAEPLVADAKRRAGS